VKKNPGNLFIRNFEQVPVLGSIAGLKGLWSMQLDDPIDNVDRLSTARALAEHGVQWERSFTSGAVGGQFGGKPGKVGNGLIFERLVVFRLVEVKLLEQGPGLGGEGWVGDLNHCPGLKGVYDFDSAGQDPVGGEERRGLSCGDDVAISGDRAHRQSLSRGATNIIFFYVPDLASLPEECLMKQ
jgi:hypothetical protein